MQNASSIRRARDLSPDQRQTLEAMLGRVLQEDECVSVRAFKGTIVKPAPTGEARDEAYRRLRARIDETAKRAEGVPEEEIDAAIDEAAEYVRHRLG